MAHKSLTDMAARNVKGKEKPYKLAAGAGLYLQVMPNGNRYWRMKYRYAGKEKLLSIGVYPEVSLKETIPQSPASAVFFLPRRIAARLPSTGIACAWLSKGRANSKDLTWPRIVVGLKKWPPISMLASLKAMAIRPSLRRHWAISRVRYRALSGKRSPDFATILKVTRALGVRLYASAA
ncbi:integrase arm-type DNA-binding domain-containing protein [Stenotrophomonas maltophilia]|uniref:Arm DNA-binding domain-containing protein n=1 Tax=Stenotrophomonas maltophilia TaxID=40324 RepID=UPI001F5591AA|nr:integrase arm-type DNA-binding domain-containing protein [Stenotrophomonas maltophilia]